MKSAPSASLRLLERGLERRGLDDHRAELQHPELALADADAPVDEEHRAARVELDRERDERPERQADHDHEDAQNEVERALDRPFPAGQHGRAELEERRALSRHVLAPLDEQLGRVGREPDLDSLAVRLLDDLEDGALVEVGLREDDLVGTRLVEDERELGPRAEEVESRDALGRDDSDELVRQPAAGAGQRAPEPREALTRADEHDAPPDPRRAHDLERRRLVRGPQEPDGDGRGDDRRRDEPGRREVVARPEPEREHDQRDDDETREDPPRARPQLALPVEARLGEHEDRDRRGELEPLGGALAPEQAPEDVAVAGDQLAEDEREVDPEREPDDVERHERRDGDAAPDDRDDRPAREQVQARGSNVAPRCGLRRGRRRTRRLRRRSELAGHAVEA